MRVDYAREKLYQAVESLISDGTLKHRVAATGQFLIRLKSEDFPQDLRKNYDNIMEHLTEFHPEFNADSSFAASTRRMTDRDAEKLAKDIFNLYVDLTGGI
jgi:hypothetical protein